MADEAPKAIRSTRVAIVPNARGGQASRPWRDRRQQGRATLQMIAIVSSRIRMREALVGLACIAYVRPHCRLGDPQRDMMIIR